jgi:cytochrome b561
MATTQQKKKSKPQHRLNSAFKELMSLHWWMAACYLILFIGGYIMADLPRGLGIRWLMYDFHKSIGVLTMGLLTWRIFTLIRVWWKKYTKRSPKLSLQWWKNFALHTSLYIFMWAVPITGYFFSNSFKSNNVKFFGYLLPDIFPQNSAMVDIGRSYHFWFSYTFLAFISLHTIAQWKVLRANFRRFLNFIHLQTKKSN